MKKNKIITKIVDFIGYLIAFIIYDNISNYLGINNKKFFSLDTALSILIFGICIVTADKIIFIIRERQSKNK